MFQENENDTYLAKPCIVVGKLKIKESDLFERKEEDEKPAVQIGKINASDLFNGASDEKGMSINHFVMLEIILLIKIIYCDSFNMTVLLMDSIWIDVKFYKPNVQPKKMKIQNLFPESSENTNAQGLFN